MLTATGTERPQGGDGETGSVHDGPAGAKSAGTLEFSQSEGHNHRTERRKMTPLDGTSDARRGALNRNLKRKLGIGSRKNQAMLRARTNAAIIHSPTAALLTED